MRAIYRLAVFRRRGQRTANGCVSGGVWGRRGRRERKLLERWQKYEGVRWTWAHLTHAHKQSPFCRETGNKENIYKREGTKIDGAIIEVILFPRLLCVGETFRKQATLVNDAVIGDTRWTSWSQYLDCVTVSLAVASTFQKHFWQILLSEVKLK